MMPLTTNAELFLCFVVSFGLITGIERVGRNLKGCEALIRGNTRMIIFLVHGALFGLENRHH